MSTRTTIDIASISTAAAALVGYLPAVAALLTIVWTCIRIYETKTVQRLIGKEGACEPD